MIMANNFDFECWNWEQNKTYSKITFVPQYRLILQTQIEPIQSWENLQAAQAHLRNTQWFSRNTLTLSIQNLHLWAKFNPISKQNTNNITIFIMLMHSSVIMSVYMLDFMCIYLKKPRNTQWYSKCLWNASSLFSTLTFGELTV